MDYPELKKMIQPEWGLMPYLATRTVVLSRMTTSGIRDKYSGSCQLPLHVDSQEILSFVTDHKVYTANCVLQGPADSALNFQNVMIKGIKDLLDASDLI